MPRFESWKDVHKVLGEFYPHVTKWLDPDVYFREAVTRNLNEENALTDTLRRSGRTTQTYAKVLLEVSKGKRVTLKGPTHVETRLLQTRAKVLAVSLGLDPKLIWNSTTVTIKDHPYP